MAPTSSTEIERLRDLLHVERNPAARLEAMVKVSLGITANVPTESIRIAMEALDLAQRMGDLLRTGQCCLVLMLAYMRMGELKSALTMGGKMLRISSKLGMDMGVLDASALMGNIYIRMGRYGPARESLERALRLSENLGETERLTAVRNSLAVLSFETGDYVTAMRMHQHNLEYLESVSNDSAMASVLSNIAMIYQEIGETDQAIAMLDRVRGIRERLGDREKEALGLAALLDAYIRSGRLEDAEVWEERLAELVADLSGTYADVRAECVRARLLSGYGEYHGALASARRAASLAMERSMVSNYIEAMLEVGRICFRLQSHTEAIEAFEDALHVSDRAGIPVYRMEASRGLADAREAIGDAAEALRRYRQYMELKEEVIGQEKRKALFVLESRYNAEKAQREREMFRLRSEKLEAENMGKARELTVLAMSLTHTMEILSDLKDHARRLHRDDEPQALEDSVDMLRKIDAALQSIDGWHAFERQFNLLHPEFTHTLSDRYPNLTSSELKICSLLRINLSTKEISVLLNVSTRAVEGHRYNIRRKLGLLAGTSLSTFLSSM